MNGLEEQADNAKAHDLYWKPLSWLRTIRPTSTIDPVLWAMFVSTMLGLEVPVLSSLPHHNCSPFAKCSCKKHYMDFHCDHTATCTTHSGATKTHDWMVGVLGPLFCTAGHTVRTQHCVTATAGHRFGSSTHVHQNGPPGDRGALHCHWNDIATQPIGLVRFQTCGILPMAEEQRLTHGGQSCCITDQPQFEVCGIVAAQCTLPLTLPFFSPSFFHTICPSPAFTSA
jgi:hypothetical protein